MCRQITQSDYENSLRKITINKNHLPLRVVGLLKVTMEQKIKAMINKNHLPLRVGGSLNDTRYGDR